MAYDFHYTPTGTGVISGKEVLEQTEDAINDLGNTAISGVQEALDKAEQALTNSENAVDDAQTALNTANNAEGVAIQAQTDVGNLSGTVANIGNRVTTAEGNISNLQGRMTTAEGNITNLQGRMTSAESNIGNLQTAVSTAQATANSAQQTATTARQQSYVFRYSGTTVVPNSTIAYSTIDNTDNIKSGDKILDVDGKLFEITAVDTTNQTVTVGSALVDLALDGDVVHTSGNETVGGFKTFDRYIQCNGGYIGNEFSVNARTEFILRSNRDTSGQSGLCISKFRQNRAQGEMSGTDQVQVTFDVLENSVRTNRSWYLNWLDWENDEPKTVEVRSMCNKVDYRLTHINNKNPGALSFPDLNNGLDISGYLVNAGTTTPSEYTPSVNGWMCIGISSDTPPSLRVFTDSGFDAYSYTERSEIGGSGGIYTRYGSISVPVVAGVTYKIIAMPSTMAIITAKLFPCLGNV